MREEFPPGPELGGTDDTPTVIDEACTVVDKEGNILLWHLPNVVSQSAEVRIGSIGEIFFAQDPKERVEKIEGNFDGGAETGRTGINMER